MPETLTRLKPDPIPALHLVPEYAAAGRLADVYARTKTGLGVPWMGVVAMAFAHYPRFYDSLWTAMEPIVGSQAFADACRALRDTAEAEAAGFALPSITAELQVQGYSQRERDDILACNEVFSAGNMPYILMATLARSVLEGRDWPGAQPIAPAGKTGPAGAKPVLIEPHHAGAGLAEVYRDVRATLGLPFVNTDYRAFARWPSYFTRAWHGLKPVVQSDAYEPAVTRVHDVAVGLAQELPNPTGLTPDRLIASARVDADPGEILSVVRLFQWLLPGLAVNVAVLRKQLL